MALRPQEQHTPIKHGFDGKKITKVSKTLVKSLVSITSPLQGEHFITTWDISQSEATNTYLKFGLKKYQAEIGYEKYIKWTDDPNGYEGKNLNQISYKLKPKVPPRFRFHAGTRDKNTPKDILPELIDHKIELKGKFNGNVTAINIKVADVAGRYLYF